MQNDKIYSDILSFVRTREEQSTLRDEVLRLKESLYEIKNNFESVLKSSIRKTVAQVIVKAIEGKNPKEVLDEILEKIDQIKFTEIVIPMDPSQALMVKILDVVADKNITIDIKVDPSIIGGVTIIKDGKFYDKSLKSLLEDELKLYV